VGELKRAVLPFTAVVGLEKLKLALIFNGVNPRIGGVLISGPKGTGKTTVVRALADLLPEVEVVDGCRFGCNPNRPDYLCQECLTRSEGGKQLKAVIPGGLSSPILTDSEIDVEMDYQSLNAIGTMLGSGGIIVLDEDTSIPHIAQKAAGFYAHESCGQCAPCREGTNMIRFLIDRILMRQGSQEDIDNILRLCLYIRGSTICAFGFAATVPIAVMIKKFRSEFEALLIC